MRLVWLDTLSGHCGWRIAVRIGLRGRVSPPVRDAVFGSAVLVALFHAGYIMTSDSSM